MSVPIELALQGLVEAVDTDDLRYVKKAAIAIADDSGLGFTQKNFEICIDEVNDEWSRVEVRPNIGYVKFTLTGPTVLKRV